MRVHEGRTYVLVAATKLQLHLEAVRQGATNVYELRPLGLHNKLTIISDLAICTKMLKNVIFFCLFCELIFLKIYDIIFIEKIKKGYGDVYG